jgi:hypothetical protein
MIGAGLAPMGIAPAGMGVPDASPIQNPMLLPALRTGLSQSSRFIDPTTKSYAFTVDGRLQGIATVPSLVDLALRTVYASSCQSNLGQTFGKIQDKGAGFSQQVRSAIGAALADLVKRKLVQVLRIDVTEYPSSPDAGIGTVYWRDMTTGIQDFSSIGP